jgi:UDP-N-acetylmuramoylalanine--D-glutamate ligase
VLLELSSFQLENPGPLRLDAAVITSLMPNHLERYPDLESYYRTKWGLLALSRGPLVLNAHGGDLRSFASRQPPAKIVWASPTDADLASAHLHETRLIGRHNLENFAVAAKLSQLLAWSPDALEAMRAFSGLEHRLENLGRRAGVLYVNDSKATAMESVLSAVRSCLETLPSDARLRLLLGGRDKNLPWSALSPLRTESSLECVFFGECAQLAQKGSGLPGPRFPSMSAAVAHAIELAKEGDTVLLSPGGTSLDEFKNFEERGRRFKEIVEAIRP